MTEAESPSLAGFERKLLDALDNDGFRRFAPRHFGRIRDDVLQFLVLQEASSQPPGFGIEYGNLLLAEPHTFLSFDLAGRLPDGAPDALYLLNSHPQVDTVLEQALIDYVTSCRPMLQRVSTLRGFLAATLDTLSDTPHPHSLFTIAASYARAGRIDDAERYAVRAREHYTRHQGASTNQWAQRGELRCTRLLESLYAGTVVSLQDGWRAGSVRALGVDILDTPTAC